MLEFSGLNIWAIVVSWVVFCAVGAYWYSPSGFAKLWEKYTKINIMKIPEVEATKILVSVVVSSLVQVVALAVILNSLEVTTILNALLVGGLVWLGFVTATTVGVTLYQRRSWKFLWLNSAYFFVVMVIASVILTIWQ